MGKDPAFLFYPGDWLSGTLGMSFEEKGAYLELLIYQFNQGHISGHMGGQVGGSSWLRISKKFEVDGDGLFFNRRLDEEKDKRKAFIISRNNNLKGTNQHSKKVQKNGGHMDGHKTSHMEDEDNTNIKKERKSVRKEENIPGWASDFKNFRNDIQYMWESAEFARIWDYWIGYKRERKDKKYTRTGEEAAVYNLYDISEANIQTAEAIVKQSVAQGYQGLFELKAKNKTKEVITVVKMNADEISRANKKKYEHK